MNALKTYFHSVGLKLPSENLVVLIKNRKESTLEKDKREFEQIKKTKDKWLSIYEKYKEKYSSFTHQPEAHSTPKLQESTTSEQKVSLVQSSELETTPEEMPKKGHHETPSQRNVDEKSETFANHTDAAESFEFVAGSNRRKKQLSKDFVETESSYETKTESSKASVESSKINKQDDISNFDDSLKVAIALLNSLLEARNMKPELKRALAGKVIQKIVQIQTSRSIQTSTLDSSGFYPISASSASSEKSSRSAVTTKKEMSPRSKRNDEAIKKCFEPSTLSEINLKQSRESSARSQKDSSKGLMELMKREKTSHLKWIEKEIAHLRNLRELLTKNDSTSSDASQPIYENVGTAASSKVAEFAVPKAPPQPDPPIYLSNKWNSHVNNRKTHKTSRSKHPTPPPPPAKEANIADLIYDRNKKLVEKYEEVHKAYEQINIYTKPRTHPKKSHSSSQKPSKPSEKPTQDVQTSTSLASSSVFDSKSTDIGISRRKQRVEPPPPLTQGQNNVETQTSDTIYRTKPFFETKELHESDYYDLSAKGTVKRVQSSRSDKRMQARPPSIKYTLSFERRNKVAARPFMSLPIASQCSGDDVSAEILTSKSSKDRINSARSTNGSVKSADGGEENKENNADTNTYFSEYKYEEIDLKSWFNSNRPDVYGRFEERRKCIDELKKLR